MPSAEEYEPGEKVQERSRPVITTTVTIRRPVYRSFRISREWIPARGMYKVTLIPAAVEEPEEGQV